MSFLSSRKLAVSLVAILILLSILGTIIPQESLYPRDDFQKWQTEHPLLSGLAISLGLTNLYTSSGYIAILVMLFLSVSVCIYRRAFGLFRNKEKRIRYGHWGSVIFHFSFLIILAGAIVSTWTRFEGMIILTEGQPFKGYPDEYIAVQRKPLFVPDPLDFQLMLQKFKPFYGTQPRYVSEVLIEDRGNKTYETVRNFHALFHKGYTFYQKGHGFSPSFILKDYWGRVIFQAFVSFKSHLQGEEVRYEDYFRIPGTGLEVEGRLYPDMIINGGKIKTKSALPDNPVIDIKIKEQGKEVYRGVIKLGQDINLDRFSLSFNDLRYWSGFRVVKDPGIPVIYLGFGTGIFGLLVRLFSIRVNLLRDEDESAERYLSGGLWQKVN